MLPTFDLEIAAHERLAHVDMLDLDSDIIHLSVRLLMADKLAAVLQK